MKRPSASFSGLPWASSLAAYCSMVITVPSGSGSPFLAASRVCRAGVNLTELLVVGAIDGGEQHARLAVLWKGDLVPAGTHGTDDGERRERRDRRNAGVGVGCHGVSPSLLARLTAPVGRGVTRGCLRSSILETLYGPRKRRPVTKVK